ncbi:1-acyl-sn-glycerol-3-phosphate acyltransferase [Algoriphagus marincola]|uniref:1-acyl-sn-glycerol-3-phosphate acyltransferase n=1 Tax=Algoriphagus marincola TaxID=264027 RepID=A0ABS7N3P5_9BACT|nr:1-acyl-sn-glycerol-3-phosphate acyltransferase [Algoriphagus marincola]MBY5950958.1 1-acyl-sn-glycerol-3-phosphate acyltransferase [Algoriphagus marincola]
MTKFDQIRPFYDAEANAAILEIVNNPMLIAMMEFSFPEDKTGQWKELMKRTHSLRDFQINFIYPGLMKVLERSSDGLSTSGFEILEPNTAYLFISNHRDIILDTSLLNACLYEKGLVMTTSAIGDNLIKKPFLKTLSRLNRNFAIRRGLKGRELLESSQIASEYISNSLLHENRSVWIAQREGRTKDGNDVTQKGVLRMLTLAEKDADAFQYFKKIKVVPVSISYEYDPTDKLKIPQLIAKARDEKYIKSENEDFLNLLRGIIGTKKRIHLSINGVLDKEIDEIDQKDGSLSDKLSDLATVIDQKIWDGYRLWPSNFIAHDMLHQKNEFAQEYNREEKEAFEKRIEEKIDSKNPEEVHNYLAMYANPVSNMKQLSTTSSPGS